MDERRIYRWEIPVDDEDHELPMGGEIVHVAGDNFRLEFWSIERTPVRARWFRVFGTGHPIPDNYAYRGTAPRSSLGCVWHLLERVEQ